MPSLMAPGRRRSLALYIAGLRQFRPSEAEAALASAARRNSQDWHGHGPARPSLLRARFSCRRCSDFQVAFEIQKSGLRQFKLAGVKIKVDATSKPEVAELPCCSHECTMVLDFGPASNFSGFKLIRPSVQWKDFKVLKTTPLAGWCPLSVRISPP